MSTQTNTANNQESNNNPIPRVASFSGWLTTCVIFFGLILAGKGVVQLFIGKSIHVSILDVIIAVVVGTIFCARKKK